MEKKQKKLTKKKDEALAKGRFKVKIVDIENLQINLLRKIEEKIKKYQKNASRRNSSSISQRSRTGI